jgi:hypothetical protein
VASIVYEKERRTLIIQGAFQIASQLINFELLAIRPEQTKNAIDAAIFCAQAIVDQVDPE